MTLFSLLGPIALKVYKAIGPDGKGGPFISCGEPLAGVFSVASSIVVSVLIAALMWSVLEDFSSLKMEKYLKKVYYALIPRRTEREPRL